MTSVVKTVADFDKIIKENDRVIVDFFAEWCGPCKRIAPELEKFAESKDFKDIKFIKVDVDESSELSEKHQVEAMPTFLFLFKSKEVSRIKGADVKGIKTSLDSLKAQK